MTEKEKVAMYILLWQGVIGIKGIDFAIGALYVLGFSIEQIREVYVNTLPTGHCILQIREEAEKAVEEWEKRNEKN